MTFYTELNNNTIKGGKSTYYKKTKKYDNFNPYNNSIYYNTKNFDDISKYILDSPLLKLKSKMSSSKLEKEVDEITSTVTKTLTK